jgi:hypothetical protein
MIMIITKNEFGEFHSYDDRPSLIDENGNIFWHKNNLFHRDNLPAKVINKDKGNVFWEWWQNGLLSNINGPAIIHINDGIIFMEYYYLNNNLHRDDGPAIINYSGDVSLEKYFLNDIEYSQQDYLKQIKDTNSFNRMT